MPSAGGRAGAAPSAGDATWNFAFYMGPAWGTAGGTIVATPSTDWQLGFGLGPVSVSSPGLADDIAFWRANPASNFGWILRYANDDGSSGPPRNQTARRFGSQENGDTAFRPTLRIEYTLP